MLKAKLMRLAAYGRRTKPLFFIVLLAALVLGSATVGVSQENQSVGLKTADGVLFVWNRPGLHFMLSIRGSEIVPLNDADHIFFKVDGLVLQIQSLPISNFAPDAKRDKLDDKSILIAHRDWESKYLETEVLKSKLTVKSANENVNGREVLVWLFDLPAAFRNADASGQMNTSVVAGDFLILLNSVLSPSVSETQARKFLLSTMSTLKVSAEPFDIKKLQEELRKGP